MEFKGVDQARAALQEAFQNYDALVAHFETLCAEAAKLAQANRFTAGRVGHDLYIDFLDRRIRISMRYDRAHAKGILYVDDVSAVGQIPEIAPLRITRIPFDYSGATEVGKGYVAGHLSLSNIHDCVTLLLNLIDMAFRRNLWDGAAA